MNLLFELRTEEIPARFMPGALMQLETIAKNRLDELGIPFGQIKTVCTPRRLTLIVYDLASRQNDKHVENKGPSLKIAFDENQNPTKAALGFAKGQGIDAKDLVVKDDYVYAVIKETGSDVKDLLPDILPGIINALAFPKNMRWGDYEMRFIRPIHSIVALYGSTVIPFAVTDVTSSNVTSGHRFLGNEKIEINSANPVEEYFAKLEENYVIADHNLRRQIIVEQIKELAAAQGATAEIDEGLLEEVIHLVEYPTAILGHFDKDYLALPPDVVITPMREHQRYFPVKDNSGNLLPVFITVRCGNKDHLDIVRHGNERVLKARLADAKFFFEEDQKTSLADKVPALKTIVFQEGLGSMYNKTMRLVNLAEHLGHAVKATPEDVKNADRAAYLSKADLSTKMVGEFSELQGIMGQEYALLNGERQEVAQAIFEHYLPRFAGDTLAKSIPGQLVGIADKIDNIVATFSRGLVPTGSQDPYALRRQALGIVNTLLEGKYVVSIADLTGAALDLLKVENQQQQTELTAAISEFFRLRLRNVLTDENIRYDIIDATLATGSDNIYDTYLRTKALAQFIEEGNTDAAQKALQALTRAGNLAKQSTDVPGWIDTSLFKEEAEEKLYKVCSEVDGKVDLAIAEKNYKAALNELLNLTKPINDFFEAVMVMVDDAAVRQNRLALLKDITYIYSEIADLNKLVVSKGE